jgi:hypothetical protein
VVRRKGVGRRSKDATGSQTLGLFSALLSRPQTAAGQQATARGIYGGKGALQYEVGQGEGHANRRLEELGLGGWAGEGWGAAALKTLGV